MSNNVGTLKPGLEVTHDHWKLHHLIDCIRLPIDIDIVTMALSGIISEIKQDIG